MWAAMQGDGRKNRGVTFRGYIQWAATIGALALSLNSLSIADEQPTTGEKAQPTAKETAPETSPDTPKAAEPAKEAPKEQTTTTDGANATGASSATAAQPAPAADPKQPPEWHRVRMRLSGSMCMSCLKAVQDEFLKIPGVQALKLRRERANSFDLYSPELSTWADCIIVYDQKRAPLAGLRSVMKQEGYYPYQVNDKLLDHEPSEADAKF